ncbi:tRNA 2-thiouridine(34) synthase MnmA [Thermus albus]|uniref:tRNA 2-thiouridine(34) synthase MnmA n=1 Tax=Thermus albus TaxID=2908146 RepID=UPI001FA96B93|nr:tRNA 2-thiouridine(34) synthase MnmA [Thermus albus]
MRKTVLVAMSGGVDSSVSAYLLKEAGYEVVGAMMRFWPEEPPKPSLELPAGRAWESCCTPEAAYEARRVAETLGIPFYLLDYRETFEEAIIKPFLQDYARGRTPNPCARCNTFVKFGALLKQAKRLGLDYVATGHYVRREGKALLRGVDPRKDQSYFLWGTSKEALPHLLFPVGGMTKAEVRALAEKAGLPTARKPESQNLCFVAGDLRSFLKERLKPRPGPLVDALTGEVVGEHQGASLYTIGQRKGLGLYKPHLERYVVGLDPVANVVYVGPKEAALWQGLEGEGANLLTELPEEVEVQVRYRTLPVKARVESLSPLRLRFASPVFAVTPGQSAAFYRGERLLGGAVIRQGLYNLAGLAQPEGYLEAERTMGHLTFS